MKFSDGHFDKLPTKCFWFNLIMPSEMSDMNWPKASTMGVNQAGKVFRNRSQRFGIEGHH